MLVVVLNFKDYVLGVVVYVHNTLKAVLSLLKVSLVLSLLSTSSDNILGIVLNVSLC